MAGKSSPGQKFTEESFGELPKQPSIGKGSIYIVGQTVNDGQKFPSDKPTGPNVKTGYPGNQK